MVITKNQSVHYGELIGTCKAATRELRTAGPTKNASRVSWQHVDGRNDRSIGQGSSAHKATEADMGRSVPALMAPPERAARNPRGGILLRQWP